MEEKEVKINLPIPQLHPHVFGQCILTSGAFSFFGGIFNENPSTEQQDQIHNGTIYTFSNLSRHKIYESTLNPKYTEIIGATTVFNDEIGISFTFGGLSITENRDAETTEFISTSNIYANRWAPNPVKEENKICFDPTSNYAPIKCISMSCPITNTFKANEYSGVMSLHTYNQIYTPDLSSERPSPRYFHSATWDPINNLMWIFGGLSNSIEGPKEYLNDLWTWSPYNGMWHKIETKNTPKPRIGASMTFLNGKIYLFGGYSPDNKSSTSHHQISSLFDDIDELSSDTDSDSKEYYFYCLDVSNANNSINKFYNLSWIPILNFPNELLTKLYGATIIPYSPSEFQSYIIFSGGSLINIYDSVTGLTESDFVKSKRQPMTIISFNVQTFEYKIFTPSESIPEVSYHSAAISKSGTLYIAGGIIKPIKNDTDYMFHGALRTINLSKFFSFASQSSSAISILFDVSDIDSNDTNKIDRSCYADFLDAVKNEIQSVSSRSRVQQLYNDFINHQTNHSPIEDFIVAGDGLFASKTVLERRIGFPVLPSLYVGNNLVHDLILYAYTDVIEPSHASNNYSFNCFRSFIRFCRQHKLFRLIIFEIASHIAHMTPYDFLSICIDSGPGFEGNPLFADENLTCICTLFARVAPNFHHLVDFSEIKELKPSLARFILSIINGRKEFQEDENGPSFIFPESDVENDLVFFEAETTIETLDGQVFADEDALDFDTNDIKRSKFEVVKAVMTTSFGPLFDIGDPDDIFSAFKLFSSCRSPIDEPRLTKILNGCEGRFLEFASSHKKFKERLVELLPKIEHPAVLEFALEMIGTNGLTVIITAENKRLIYNSTYGSSTLPSSTINVNVTTSTILALFVLMYGHRTSEIRGSDIVTLLPSFFDMRDLADELLTLCATSYLISPCSLRRAVGEFIISELLLSSNADDSIESRFLDLFPRLFDANLHEDAARLVHQKSATVSEKSSPARKRNQKNTTKNKRQFDVSHLAQLAADDPKYIEGLSEEQIGWLIEKSRSSRNNQTIAFTDSDDDDDSILDEVSTFSK